MPSTSGDPGGVREDSAGAARKPEAEPGHGGAVGEPLQLLALQPARAVEPQHERHGAQQQRRQADQRQRILEDAHDLTSTALEAECIGGLGPDLVCLQGVDHGSGERRGGEEPREGSPGSRQRAAVGEEQQQQAGHSVGDPRREDLAEPRRDVMAGCRRHRARIQGQRQPRSDCLPQDQPTDAVLRDPRGHHRTGDAAGDGEQREREGEDHLADVAFAQPLREQHAAADDRRDHREDAQAQ